MAPKMKFYSLNRILECNAHYNLVIGERSNGKTYQMLYYAIEQYWKTGAEVALIRRMDMDFKQKRGDVMFEALIANGEISKITNGAYKGIVYRSMRWWLCNYDDEGKPIPEDHPFCYAFSLTSMEHDKSTSYPNVRTIIFDEFLARSYLANEFILLMNTLSTIIRHRNDVKIFMAGNTINQYAPYFGEFGITNIKNMKPGDIDVYTYGDSGLRLAIEFSDSPNKSKPSDVYFAFDNPKLNMITGKGNVWELDMFPHIPEKYLLKDVIFNYFIVFNGDILHCEIIHRENRVFTYIHRKTTPIKDENRELIFSLKYDSRRNWKRKIARPQSPIEKFILDQFQQERVFYQDNEVGMEVQNFIQASNSGEKDL